MNEFYALIQRYFPQDQWANAYRVMMAESGGDPNAANDQVPKRERSYGLFQINTNVHDLTPDEARDPETNVRYAASLYEAQGWRPWSAAQVPGVIETATPPGAGQGMGAGVVLPAGAQRTPGQGGSNVVAPQQPSYRPSYPAGAGAEPNRNQTSYNMDLLQKALGPYANVTRLPPRKDAAGLTTETEGYRYQWANGLYLDIYGNPETPNEESGTALDWLEKQANKTQTSGNTDDVTLQDGSVWRVDTSDPVKPKPLYQVKPAPAQAQPKYQMGSSSGPLIPIFDPTTGKTNWRPNPNYDPAERTQTGLENERLRRSMQPLGAQQMKDLAAQQQQIQALLASGDIDVETANKLMDAARKNISATMRGTTLFQQEQADEENRQQRLSRAGQLIGTKLAQSSGLAGNFLSSALSGAGGAMMPAGKTTLGLDPLALARNYSASQGGDELSRLAALLTGGAGGGQPEMSEEEYQQRMAGLNGQGAK